MIELLRGDPEFERAVVEGSFNALLPAERPEIVVRPRSETEAVAAVRAVAAAGQRIAVRSGGHSWVAASVRDGGVLIDLGALDGIGLDTERMTATVGPGVRGARLSAALEEAGLAFPVGHCGDPGVGGFLLGGGLGVNWGHWRPACFSIERMRVVTADGELRTASPTENPDLFWLARGSGPGFPGVVTEFELALRPLPPCIRVETLSYPLDRLGEVTRWLTDASQDLPTNVELSLVTAGSPDPAHPFVVGVAATVFAGSVAEADAALAPLHGAPAAHRGRPADPLAHTAPADVAFSALHEAVDATYPRGARYLADTFWTDLDLHDATAPLAALLERAPSKRSYVLAGMPANGAGAGLVTPGEAAYGMHDRTLLIVYTIWEDAADDAANRAWLDEVADALLPTATGHFLSEADLRHRPDRVPGSFAPADRARVEHLRGHYDPDHLFHGFPALVL
ncbi:FAD-binding oxidoreductase [Herbiconiux sp. CPCC 203407]|uniref:FAD-binding oxidoreductase n=1 Tax=Herbiconiux oxytropis TaxID=2970915 RepID=A0AA42BVS7_9MICO|nr:FAD-binding oxidoreductase [Herbiconiux oxytropis]MCS5723608.1 FAD-binding oxidoreductase [Herbiconiux oxytropis]MCS5727686.1 FAD-binding oxidoreductase [Herbiconiux oxytropis]